MAAEGSDAYFCVSLSVKLHMASRHGHPGSKAVAGSDSEIADSGCILWGQGRAHDVKNEEMEHSMMAYRADCRMQQMNA